MKLIDVLHSWVFFWFWAFVLDASHMLVVLVAFVSQCMHVLTLFEILRV